MPVIDRRWTAALVLEASRGACRFSQFHAALGISRRVLADRLGDLVEHDLMVRTPYQVKPVRHEYRLTEKGEGLVPVLLAMNQWKARWDE